MSIEVIQGDSIAPGFAVGTLCFLNETSRAKPSANEAVDSSLEIERFRQQVHVLKQEIEETVVRLETGAYRDEAEIMRTHLALLQDPELHGQIFDLIENARHCAETAVEQVLQSMATMLASAEDPLLAERAADLRDLAIRMEAGFSKRRAFEPLSVRNEVGCVIVALPELMPSLVLEARELGVAGFIVGYGTGVSHAAILAKSFGMPVLRVVNLEAVALFAGQNILVWGEGELLVEPSEAELAARRCSDKVISTERVAGAPEARVWISIVDPEQLEAVEWAGIEGVGLYRSEALFMRHREDFPSEQEQFTAYRRLFRLAGRRPVVFRTVDLGADKPVEHMRFGPQVNPSLGLRAHRLFRFHPELLITQIRALLRAASGDHRLRLMFPMLETIDQLRFVQSLVDKAIGSLIDEGATFQNNFRQGVLVETPSAAWSFHRLLKEVDFASIGTNDLVQYLFAVERNTANVADLYQSEHPVVLQVIHHLTQIAADAGKPIFICGEMAADMSLLPVLVGLGLRDFSLAMGTVAIAMRDLSGLDETACQRLARQCLESDTVKDVRALLNRPHPQSITSQVTTESDAVDPVCGMVVHSNDTPYVFDAGKLSYYFCSRSCLDYFVNHSKHGGGTMPE